MSETKMIFNDNQTPKQDEGVIRETYLDELIQREFLHYKNLLLPTFHFTDISLVLHCRRVRNEMEYAFQRTILMSHMGIALSLVT